MCQIEAKIVELCFETEEQITCILLSPRCFLLPDSWSLSRISNGLSLVLLVSLVSLIVSDVSDSVSDSVSLIVSL